MPYIPTADNLDTNTVSLNSTHKVDMLPKADLSVHNINGHSILMKMNQAYMSDNTLNTNKPFLVSESSWPGSGQYGAGVITNQHRTWDDLKNTISQAMALSLFGVGNTLVDSCGSLGKLD